MAGIVTRKPVVGFATALIFSFLGLLLIDRSADEARNVIVLWMFRILGWFLLFAALGSLVVACIGIIKRKSEKQG